MGLLLAGCGGGGGSSPSPVPPTPASWDEVTGFASTLTADGAPVLRTGEARWVHDVRFGDSGERHRFTLGGGIEIVFGNARLGGSAENYRVGPLSLGDPDLVEPFTVVEITLATGSYALDPVSAPTVFVRQAGDRAFAVDFSNTRFAGEFGEVRLSGRATWTR